LACAEFTGNIVGYSFSVVSSVSFSVDERIIIQTSRSGPIIFALSLTQIYPGVFPFSSNASLVPYSPEELFSYLKAHGTRDCFSPCHPCILTLVASWLIDNDKDQEGLQVLADLHGGDLNNSVAQAEFKEIRAKVILEVCFYPIYMDTLIYRCLSVNQGRVDLIKRCGISIADVFC
jgi:hypothetical protein